MAKKQQRAAQAATLSEQIEQQEQAELLRSAKAKGFRGLSGAEKAAVRKNEESTLVRLLGSVGKTLSAWLLDTQSKQIRDAMRNRGFPWPEGNKERVNLIELLRWLWRYFIEHPLPDAKPGGLTEDDVLLVGASQELKDEFLRQRIVERRLVIQQKEHELLLARESHLPTVEVQQVLAEAAQLIAKKREYLERTLPPEAARVVAQGFDDIADAIERQAEVIHEGYVDAAFEQLGAG
ncbi:hypothetical protein KOR34_02230 [Posidoniimonas corsicana]|uniref:Uncharacterized protein n=1 Tax=Posidoniimonas corsicana TaxID=1938618 RepID=A0A5C5VBH1_9BACT|nr:hypothetical protein [Posidoniimonas corsicana]TWT35333.1 hypothetical protein KOR34_02230 [Posidoniimonas corsicana]